MRVWLSLLVATCGAPSLLGAQDAVTFNNQIVRIFQDNCQTCHRPGDIAPFSLLRYEDAQPRARAILSQVEQRRMPPWPPSNPHGTFRHERALTEEQIQLIRQWVSDGSPQGVPIDLPEPRTFTEGWSSREPDMVIQPVEFFTPLTSETDVYKCFSIPVDSRSDLFISGYEVVPGNREIVHHVLMFADEKGESAALDAADPEPGYTCFGGPGFSASGGIGGWAPGATAQFFPEGIGVRLGAGARVVMQVHYNFQGHPHGLVHDASTAERHDPGQSDRTRVGFFLSDKPFQRSLLFLPLVNTQFTIPPDEPSYQVRASLFMPIAVHLHSIAPHMHLLGREIEVEAQLPDGSVRNLIRIPRWDFNWQGNYAYPSALAIPAGTRFLLKALYDNSAANPNNPSSPPIPVRWGERTTDEMCLTFLAITIDNPILAGLFR